MPFAREGNFNLGERHGSGYRERATKGVVGPQIKDKGWDMARLFTEEELEGRLDCFGQFECTDEICLFHCGVNISCAACSGQEGEEGWNEDETLDPMEVGLE